MAHAAFANAHAMQHSVNNMLGVANPHVGGSRYHDVGSKRKKSEEAGMEPAGHGNTPATGTEQEGYIQKFVPCDFPDKFTVKLKYTNNYQIRSIGVAGSYAPSLNYLYWSTNSMNAIDHTNTAVLAGYAHHPNQFANWKAQWGYYRVERLDYCIHVANTANSQFTDTSTPPGGFVGPQSQSDAIVTLLRTQMASDLTNITQPQQLWEQKQANNVYLEARAPGSTKTMHTFHGTINPEDYDIDPLATAADETWTAVTNQPLTTRYLGLSVYPVSPQSVATLLPEVGLSVFIEFFYTVQFAGYYPALRQSTN